MQFAIPILVATCGTLAVGIIPVLMGWIRASGEWRNATGHAIPKALCGLAASFLVILIGFIVFLVLLDPISTDDGHLIWFIFFGLCASLNLAALALSHQERATLVSVLTGSIAVVLVHVLGVLLFYWGG